MPCTDPVKTGQIWAAAMAAIVTSMRSEVTLLSSIMAHVLRGRALNDCPASIREDCFGGRPALGPRKPSGVGGTSAPASEQPRKATKQQQRAYDSGTRRCGFGGEGRKHRNTSQAEICFYDYICIGRRVHAIAPPFGALRHMPTKCVHQHATCITQ